MQQTAPVIKLVFAVILSVLTSFGSLSVFGGPKKEEDLRLSVAAMSDTHITNELYRRLIFAPGVADVTKNVQPDLFLVTGDCTDNGNEANWEAFKSVLDKRLAVPHTLITFGNHDAWTSYDTPHDYEEAKANYLKYANAIMGTNYDSVYFSTEIGGYPFIVMGSEGTSVGMDVTDAQLDWLNAALANAAAAYPGKPLFVVNHQPLNFTHAVGDNEHGSGIDTAGASEKLQAILDSQKNVIYITGHQHYGLNTGKLNYPEGFTTVEHVGENITSVNLPSYEYGSFGTGGNAWIGQGAVFNVYDDRVEILGRNFALHGWVKDFSVTVPIN